MQIISKQILKEINTAFANSINRVELLPIFVVIYSHPIDRLYQHYFCSKHTIKCKPFKLYEKHTEACVTF